MGWIQLVLFVGLAAFAMKAWNNFKTEARERGIAVAQKQIADTALAAERDSKRETARLLALRPARQKAATKTQETRKVEDAKEAKSDPAYRAWAEQPVPDYVVDRLFANAGADDNVRLGAGDGEPRTPVQTDRTASEVAKDVFSRFGRVRL